MARRLWLVFRAWLGSLNGPVCPDCGTRHGNDRFALNALRCHLLYVAPKQMLEEQERVNREREPRRLTGVRNA